jgi:hypothetical protein
MATKAEANALYYERHKDEIKARVSASYHALSPAEKLERGRTNKTARPDAVKRERKAYFDKLKSDVIGGYGGACECCGTTYMAHLTLDHINGGGNQERKQQSNRVLYTRLRREGYPRGEYRVLCFNCNFATHVEGECGCQKAASSR